MHEMTKHYLIAALWSSTDNNNEQGGDPLDQNYDLKDIAPESIDQAEKDCLLFLRISNNTVPEYLYPQAGHDFWLTRNRHGSGFWGRPEVWNDRQEFNAAKAYTALAHTFRELSPVVGDDGKIYFE